MPPSRLRLPAVVAAAVLVGIGAIAVVRRPAAPAPAPAPAASAPAPPVLREPVAGNRGQATVRLGVPANPEALRVSGPPVIGEPWNPRVDHDVFVPDAVVDLLVLAQRPLERHLPGIGTLLCDPAGPHVVRWVPASVAFHFRVPSDGSLVGRSYTAQGVSVGSSGPRLTNALDVVVGFPGRDDGLERRR